ncbi:MAG: hypothetical protein PHF86_14240 [Candidatus Nanoarchaeia archaeon]|jgi:hypothetical protein|nr:hypothetical protein [Candidatus Nanoarchaeia archaeon]
MPNIKIEDVKVANITVDQKKSCTCFKAANGHIWYLKGSTLEVTVAQTANTQYSPYTQERLATGRCGKIIGTIKKVNTNDDLTANLKILASLHTTTKTAKKENTNTKTPEPPKPKTKKTPAKKTAKKTSQKPKEQTPTV